MKGLGLVLVMLAACGDKPGVYVEIHTDKIKDVQSVAIYIGNMECTDSAGDPCGIAPQDPMMPNGPLSKIHPVRPGGTYYRDVDVPFVASASGGVARIHVEAGSSGDRVQLAVLGLDGSGTPIATALARDVPVPASTTSSLSLTLSQADQVSSSEEDLMPHPDGDYFLRWQDPAAPIDCVLVEHWADGTPVQVFVVPQEDSDCDGVLNEVSGMKNPKECDPRTFKYADASASVDTSDCATGFHLPVGTTASCLLGGAPCIDGQGVTTSTCTRTDTTVCVPNAACDPSSPCANGPQTVPLSTCLEQVQPGAFPHIQCFVFTADADGQPCAATTNAVTGPINLGGLFMASTHTCTKLEFTDDSLANVNAQSALQLQAPSAGKLDVSVPSGQPAGTCMGTLTWDGAPILAPPGVADFWPGAVLVTASNGNQMLVPIQITVSSGCANYMATAPGINCYYGYTGAASTESITNCAL